MCGKQKNHQRNSCNKNQSERREKAPRRAPAGRSAPPCPHAAVPILILHLSPIMWVANDVSKTRFGFQRVALAGGGREPHARGRRFRQKGVCFYFFGAEKNQHAPALHLLNMRHAATQTRAGVCRIHFHLRHLIVPEGHRAAVHGAAACGALR
ncbi:unnamed protein product [Diatraea saccharalis]|uniref:Uncharacterized protein n=1 Tax=Diatraea saccharalis TaxID=40085 RepID=A0A9N9WI23_9NEOP|nr:unnamed protein product [Diatraea saccharalis]